MKKEIQKRVERVIDEDSNPTSDSFATLEGNKQLSLFPPDTYVHELSANDLRSLSYYLCKTQLFSSSNLGDNYHYWGWSLICFTSIHFPDREFIDAPEGLVQDITGVLRLLFLRNLKTILRELDQHKWKNSREPKLPIENSLEKIVPSPHEIQNQIARVAFSTLEASLRRYCKEVDLTGKPIEEQGYNSYISNYTHRGKVKYEDLLNLWKDHNANPATEETLNKIQHIYKNNDKLLADIDKMAEKYHFEGENHDLFWLIRKVRNANIHGEIEDIFGSPEKFTYLIVNLLCLVLWDSVDDETFDNNLDEFISINERHSNSDLRTRPEDLYYPAFTSEVEYRYLSV